MNRTNRSPFTSSLLKRGRFTLLELLTVIAVIAILVAMLLPTLARARRMAKVVVCVNNQRQIVIGLTMYATSNNTYYPSRRWGDLDSDATKRGGASVHKNSKGNGFGLIDIMKPYYGGTLNTVFKCPLQHPALQPNTGEGDFDKKHSNQASWVAYNLVFGVQGPASPFYNPEPKSDVIRTGQMYRIRGDANNDAAGTEYTILVTDILQVPSRLEKPLRTGHPSVQGGSTPCWHTGVNHSLYWKTYGTADCTYAMQDGSAKHYRGMTIVDGWNGSPYMNHTGKYIKGGQMIPDDLAE